ncbi:hypothetical protein RyT2_27960 [Pseudolactococcus yaeyamensis]
MFDSTTTVQANNGLIAKTQVDSYFVREHVNNIWDLTCETPVNGDQPVEVLQILIVGDYFIAEVVNRDDKEIDEVVADVFTRAVKVRQSSSLLAGEVEELLAKKIQNYADMGYQCFKLFKDDDWGKTQSMISYCLSERGRSRLESLGYKIIDIDNKVTVSWKK